nr:hypothetical protein Iba_chr15aCG3300 [Ipomoea batatas]
MPYPSPSSLDESSWFPPLDSPLSRNGLIMPHDGLIVTHHLLVLQIHPPIEGIHGMCVQLDLKGPHGCPIVHWWIVRILRGYILPPPLNHWLLLRLLSWRSRHVSNPLDVKEVKSVHLMEVLGPSSKRKIEQELHHFERWDGNLRSNLFNTGEPSTPTISESGPIGFHGSIRIKISREVDPFFGHGLFVGVKPEALP